MSTATEVRIRQAEFDRRMAPARARLNSMFGEHLALAMKIALKRRRKSKGWRRHVRAVKAMAKQ